MTSVPAAVDKYSSGQFNPKDQSKFANFLFAHAPVELADEFPSLKAFLTERLGDGIVKRG